MAPPIFVFFFPGSCFSTLSTFPPVFFGAYEEGERRNLEVEKEVVGGLLYTLEQKHLPGDPLRQPLQLL